MLRTPYEEGRAFIFMKLGVATQSVSRKSSTSEMENPIDNQDDHLPAGTLARTLAAVDDEPEHFSESQSSDGSVEDRMNRKTTWTEPSSIPVSAGTGPSPITPGSF